jgi:hypothetical protein
MAIFNSYVSLPEGKHQAKCPEKGEDEEGSHEKCMEM